MTQNDLATTIRQRIEEKPSTMTHDLARELGVKEVDIVRNFPEGMALEVPGEQFETIWKRMTEWEKVTFICISSGCVTEVSGPLPAGKFGHGMFNLRQANNPLGGHIMIANLESIWLISKPMFGMESHSVQFFAKSGEAMCAVYLGRNEDRKIIESIKQDFLALKNEYKG